MRPHWPNPWSNAVFVPLNALAELCIMPDPNYVRYRRSEWYRAGDKLDCYLVWWGSEPNRHLSAGVRYGPDAGDYLSPAIIDYHGAKKLYKKWERHNALSTLPR